MKINLNKALILLSVIVITSFSACKKTENIDSTNNLSKEEIENINIYLDNIFNTINYIITENNEESYYLSKQSEIEQHTTNINTVSEPFNSYIAAFSSSNSFETAQEFITFIESLESLAINDDRLNEDERYAILIASEATTTFVEKAITYFENENNLKSSNLKINLKSWWSKWGKCAAGVVGGSGLGGLAGGAITTPTVIGIPAGVVVGVVAGGLSGAAAAC